MQEAMKQLQGFLIQYNKGIIYSILIILILACILTLIAYKIKK